MGWKQTKAFDIGKAGTEKYLCLKNVRLGYGIASKWEYARQDWDNNVAKHADQNFPAGVAVPVYFSWVGTLDGIRRDWGHVAVRLPDGRIWTDGKYYANVSTLAANYLSGGSYLGWGEGVNGVRVVEYVPDPPKEDPRDKRIRELEAELAAERSKPPVVKEVTKEVPVEKIVEKEVVKEVPVKDPAQEEEIRALKQANKTLSDEVGRLKEALLEKPKEVEKKIVVDPSYYPAGDLFRALLQKAVAWFNKKG